MRNAAALAIFVLVAVASPGPRGAARADSIAFSNGTKAFASGDYVKALAYFDEAKNAGVGGPAIHYNIGVCSFRLRDYDRAESEFRLVADQYPRMRALAEYNVGLVLHAEGREAEARKQFELARQASTDEKITRLAETMLRRGDAAAGSPSRGAGSADSGAKWVSLVDFNVGHDDNVVLLDDSSLPAGQSAGSAFSELLAFVSGPISSESGFRFSGSVYAVDYADTSEFNETAARIGGAYRWSAGEWSMEAEIHFSDSTLDGDAFESRLGAGLTLRRPLTSATALGLSLVHEAVDPGDSRFAFLDGSREQLGVTWDRYGMKGRLTLAYRYESNDRDSAAVSAARNGVSLSYRYAMSPAWTADLSLGVRRSAFDDNSGRSDEDRYDVSAGMRRRFGRSWHMSGAYLWSENRSDVTAFTYTRTRLSLGVTKDF
jgi:tetratricopeptide (TPR) repeat protein